MALFQWLKNINGEQPAIPSGPAAPPLRKHYRFSGIVQGVGFRYEARILAGQLHLTGWARNNSDGTVDVELQGDERAITEFLRVIQTVPRFHINDIQAENIPLSKGEATFSVKY